MLTAICEEIRNYFPVKGGIHAGTFTISGGSIAPLDFLQEGQYFRIKGSIFNDGVYQYPVSDLTDEVFCGEVWALAVPSGLISLVVEIEKYAEITSENTSPFTSENYPNGYSYTIATDENGIPMSWQKFFANRLNRWRKL